MPPVVAYEVSGEEGSPLGVAPGEKIYVHWTCIPEAMRADEYTVRGVGWKELPQGNRDYKCHECNGYLIDNPDEALRNDPEETGNLPPEEVDEEPPPEMEEDDDEGEEEGEEEEVDEEVDGNEPPRLDETMWACPRCGGLNTAGRDECYFACGYVAHTRAGLATRVRVIRVEPEED